MDLKVNLGLLIFVSILFVSFMIFIMGRFGVLNTTVFMITINIFSLLAVVIIFIVVRKWRDKVRT